MFAATVQKTGELSRPISTPAVVEARNVSKTYGDLQALRDISFRIPEGEFACLVGPSGCGKSTLFQLLSGLMKSTTGDIYLDGEKLSGPRPDKIALVFQEATLLPWKSAIQNVMFPLSVQGVRAKESQERALHYLKMVGLIEFINALPHELSGGMRQRVAIARGLAQEPRVILMDEPYGALDEQTRTKMGDDLLRIWEESRKTILLITHSLTEAIYLSDTIYAMGSRPGCILERIEIDLPRPRNIDVIGSPEFGSFRNRLWHLLSEPHIEVTGTNP